MIFEELPAISTTSATVTTSIVATFTASTSTTCRTLFFWTSLINSDDTRSTIISNLSHTIVRCNSCICFLICRHFYESETTRSSCFSIKRNKYIYYFTILRKKFSELVSCHTIRKISDKKSYGHEPMYLK